MVERGHEPDVARKQQHAVAEHVARHVAYARDGEAGALRIDAELPENDASPIPTRRAR